MQIALTAWIQQVYKEKLVNKTNLPKTILFTGLLIAGFSFSLFANPAKGDPDDSTKLGVIAYNVACGQWATPERIAQELKVLKPDIVLLLSLIHI